MYTHARPVFLTCISSPFKNSRPHAEAQRRRERKAHTEDTEGTASDRENLLQFSLWLCVSV
jgi:hypothetical protein